MSGRVNIVGHGSNELILDTLKDSVETFYPYDFTGLVADIINDEESHFEINLDVEAPTEEPVNNSVEVSDDRNALSASYETAIKLLQEENSILTAIDYD